jgi:glucose/mannose-6-phosphate isomerase
LLDSKILEKFDTLGMHKVYDRWPEIARNSYNSEFKPINFQNIDHVIFSGMGGSGILGNVFSSIMSQTDIFVTVSKGYHLPKSANERTLVISTSISGNTVETFSFLRSAKKLGCKTISFAGGGKMEDFCLKNNMEFYSIPMIHSPRSSFIQFLFSMIKILNPILNVSKKDIKNSFEDLENTSNIISSKNLTDTISSNKIQKFYSRKLKTSCYDRRRN